MISNAYQETAQNLWSLHIHEEVECINFKYSEANHAPKDQATTKTTKFGTIQTGFIYMKGFVCMVSSEYNFDKVHHARWNFPGCPGHDLTRILGLLMLFYS